jgi:hypothetical protein
MSLLLEVYHSSPPASTSMVSKIKGFYKRGLPETRLDLFPKKAFSLSVNNANLKDIGLYAFGKILF